MDKANATRDCWSTGAWSNNMHTAGDCHLPFVLKNVDLVADGRGSLHEVAASLALDGMPVLDSRRPRRKR